MEKNFRELWLLWKKSVSWDEKTIRQKLIAAWFSLSFIIVGISGNAAWWVITLAVVNLCLSAYYAAKYVPVPEEDIV